MDGDGEPGEQDPRAFWESRYAEAARIWSGGANAVLMAEVEALVPGRALDLGCGEGGDTIWPAMKGWQVTAIDISPTAVSRARSAALESGVPPESVTWLVEDLSRWEPPGDYELVSACFLLSPLDFRRAEVLRRAAGAIVPGGHLLVVSHAAMPPWAAHHHEPHEMPTPEEELASLELLPDEWEVLKAETRKRAATGPNGEQAVLDDTVVLVRKL